MFDVILGVFDYVGLVEVLHDLSMCDYLMLIIRLCGVCLTYVGYVRCQVRLRVWGYESDYSILHTCDSWPIFYRGA